MNRAPEPRNAECAFCHQVRSVQPWGVGGRMICTDCAQRPDQKPTVMANLMAWLVAVELESMAKGGS